MAQDVGKPNAFTMRRRVIAGWQGLFRVLMNEQLRRGISRWRSESASDPVVALNRLEQQVMELIDIATRRRR